MSRILAFFASCTLHIVVQAQEATISNSTQPYFCVTGPCAPYDLLENTGTYEVRRYAQGQFVRATNTNVNYTEAFTLAFRGGYQYLLGFNANRLPVVADDRRAGWLIAEANFNANGTAVVTVNLPLLPELLNKTDPPQPLDQNVTIVSGFQGVFAVISYGGVAEDMIIKSLASSLSQNLTSAGFEYDKTILSVIYDDPIKLRDRHNEIWFRLQNYRLRAAGVPAQPSQAPLQQALAPLSPVG